MAKTGRIKIERRREVDRALFHAEVHQLVRFEAIFAR
jgi:hypothetical protein